MDVDENKARAFPYLQQRSRPPAPFGKVFSASVYKVKYLAIARTLLPTTPDL